MAAGTSAHEMATTAWERAAQLEQEAAQQRELAGRMAVAAETEHRTARTLGRLTALGYRFLTDRSWPRGGAANVDLVAIGPGGVFILDTKCWAETRVADGRIFRRGQDATGDLRSMVALLGIARTELADVGLPPALVVGVVVLAGRSGSHGQVSGLEVVGEREGPAFVARHGIRLDDHQVDILVRRCQ